MLWSRLGNYDRQELHRLLYDERTLVDHWVHIVAARELPLHAASMRRYPRANSARARYLRKWMRDNARFRRYVMTEIKRRGPVRSRDLEDRAEVPWQTGGWNDGKSLGRMLDALWFSGKIAVVGRRGRERIWDLAIRHPAYQQPNVSAPITSSRIVASQLFGLGIARLGELGVAFDGRVWGAHRALTELVEKGEAVPVTISGRGGAWVASRRLLESEYTPRSTLLSPFDNLIADRDRAEHLFDFRFRLEIYQPAERRRHGYFVMPLLHGDQLIARADVRRNPTGGGLETGQVHAQVGVDPILAQQTFGVAAGQLAAWLSRQRQ